MHARLDIVANVRASEQMNEAAAAKIVTVKERIDRCNELREQKRY